MDYMRFLIIIQFLHIIITFELAACDTPPQIIAHPESAIFRSFDSVTLACEGEGQPEVSYEWTKNGAVPDLNEQNIQATGSGGSITLHVLRSADAGEYQCIVQNIHGKALSDKAVLRQAYLHRLEDEPTNQTATRGDPLILNCSYDSYPKPSIYWKVFHSGDHFEGDDLIESSRRLMGLDGNLYFTDTLMTDGDTDYSCYVLNSLLDVTIGSPKKSVLIQSTNAVENKAPALLYQAQSEVVVGILGENVTLQCIFSGCPTPVHSWEKKKGSLPSGRSEIRRFGTSLYISDLQLQDEGDYICSATNIVDTDKIKIKLKVRSPPRFVKMDNNATATKPINQEKTEGESASFFCKTESRPQADISWSIDGESITSQPESLKSRLHITDKGRRLTIVDLCKTCSDGSSDMMVLQCNASNRFGYVFAQGYLNIIENLLNVTIRPENAEPTSWNTTVLFNCDVLIDPMVPLNLTWSHSNKQVDINRPEYSVDGNNLVIDFNAVSNIDDTESIEGQYVCTVCTQFNCTSASAMLSFKGLRSSIGLLIQYKESCHSIRSLGSSALLVCEAMSSDNDVTRVVLKWFNQDGHEVNASIGRVYKESTWNGRHPQLLLFISNIEKEDAGRYRCEATMQGIHASDSIYLQIHEDITFVRVPRTQYSNLGSDAVIKCVVEGNPMPEIQWRLRGSVIKTGYSERYIASGGNLTILDVTEEDAGSYECRASVQTTARFDSRFVDFRVKAMMYPLNEVTFEPVDSTHILFDLDPHPDGVNITGYYVLRTCVYGCGIYAISGLSGPRILEMRPATEYYFNIEANRGSSRNTVYFTMP